MKNDKFLIYSVSGDYEGVKIAPMLLIPFVENAFKHSVDSDVENGIVIEIKVIGDRLYFYCTNLFDKKDMDKDRTHGIGLENVKNRLELIYPQKHKLEISANNSVYKVKLELQLQLHEN